jgi:hypothetical protein
MSSGSLLKGKRVLIVEDDAEIALSHSNLMEKQDCLIQGMVGSSSRSNRSMVPCWNSSFTAK